MEHIGRHIDSPSARSSKERQTERGELMRYFMAQINPGRAKDGLPPLTMGRMGRLLVAIPTRDLYFLKSVCDDTAGRGGSFSKKFFWEIKPKDKKDEAHG